MEIDNEVAYEGILTGLRLGKALGAKNLLVQNDSKLVIGQIRGGIRSKGRENAEIPQADKTSDSGVR